MWRSLRSLHVHLMRPRPLRGARNGIRAHQQTSPDYSTVRKKTKKGVQGHAFEARESLVRFLKKKMSAESRNPFAWYTNKCTAGHAFTYESHGGNMPEKKRRMWNKLEHSDELKAKANKEKSSPGMMNDEVFLAQTIPCRKTSQTQLWQHGKNTMSRFARLQLHLGRQSSCGRVFSGYTYFHITFCRRHPNDAPPPQKIPPPLFAYILQPCGTGSRKSDLCFTGVEAQAVGVCGRNGHKAALKLHSGPADKVSAN